MAASSWQRRPAPCPALPRRLPPTTAGQTGSSAIVSESKPSPKGSALLGAATPPSQARVRHVWQLPGRHGMGTEGTQPGTGTEGALVPSQGARAAGGAGALGGVGSSGALDVGYRRWPRACWSPASPDWKLLPADGCLAAGTERGPEAFQMAEAGRTGWGHPRPGGSEMLLRTHAAGDSPTARPFLVPPDPLQMLGHPTGPPQASLKPRRTPTLLAMEGGHAIRSGRLSTPGQMESG